MGVRLKIGDAANLYNFTIFFEVGYLQCFSQPSLNSVKLRLESHRATEGIPRSVKSTSWFLY